METATPSTTVATVNPYSHLVERALNFVADRGGSVSEDALISFVFGSSGSVAMWQPLLRTILAGNDRLFVRPDGYWSLAQLPVAQAGGMLTDFVAIDVETTGLQPLRQRIIEVGLVRFRNGEAVARFASLVNPGKRIPKFITSLTGIDNDQVAEAPNFSTIAAEVEAFLGPALLVGHNVGFDIGFLNAELGRVGRVNLINERLDVMGLATRLVPGLRRPSLDKVALHVGLNPRKIHRATADAELTGNVAIQLAARARDIGIDSLDRLRAISRPTSHNPAGAIARGGSYLDRSILAGIPKRAGVYLMHDTNERILYIGKAKNLRDRVSSYFSQPLGYTRKMDGLLESISRIETVETGSELAALLLESQLIRRYQPRYNVAMRASEEYPFIRVDLANAWPRIMLAKARKEDGSIYFGPFKSRKAVQAAIDLVNDAYPLRTCTRTFKSPSSYGSPCIQLDLGKCLGPCTGRASRDDYMRHVHDALAFLAGDDDLLLTRLQEQLETSAETLDFERARKLRNSIHLLQQLVTSHRRLKEARERNTLVIVQPGAETDSREVFLVIAGQIWASFTVRLNADRDELRQQLARSWERFSVTGLPAVDHQTLDDVAILSRWIARFETSAVIRYLPTESAIDWHSTVAWALTLSDDEIINPVPNPLAEDTVAESVGSGHSADPAFG